MKWPIYLGPDEHGRRKYFAVDLARSAPDPRVIPAGSYWRAMHPTMGFPLGVRIRLVPVLEDAERCKEIQDASLAEDCRQLNMYAAAMSVRENDDDESKNRAAEFCREVDHSRFSEMCQASLNGSALGLRTRHLRGDHTLTADVPARVPSDLFPPVAAGVPRYHAAMYDDGTDGTGRRAYEAEYLQQNLAVILAQIEEFPNAERAKSRLAELPGGFTDHASGTDSEVEFQPGQKIERHRGAQQSGAFWLSGNRVVLIRFDWPFAKEDEVIATYLASFPSTL